nr:winged helix-turn-helix domain-containing protein [Candidatus Njordarchaeum guaymaensis]
MSSKGREPRGFDLEPRAYLRRIQNVLPGLRTRTKIIRALKDATKPARRTSNETGLSYKVVIYHLNTMENEKIVTHKGKRPKVWRLTGLGQQKIM